jgi:hypothetical protein
MAAKELRCTKERRSRSLNGCGDEVEFMGDMMDKPETMATET